jgi:hypothetical protein
MKSEWKLFAVIAGFVFAMAAVYGWWTANYNPENVGGSPQRDATTGGLEWIGTLALIMSGLLLSMVASALWLISRRIEPRPEDRSDAEIADGAGDLGFFSPGSYWPIAIAAAAAIASIAIAFQQWWMVALGLIGVIITTCGLMFEYYTGSRRSAEH